jgi:endonuclease YncB( thermonuclease family)
MIATGGVSVGILIGLAITGSLTLPVLRALPDTLVVPDALAGLAEQDPADSFACRNPHIVDGDTLRCGKERVRLQGIDAPEMPGSCRPGRDCVEGDPFASTEHLRDVARRGPLRCTRLDVDHYGRTVARCEAGGVDLSCAQIEAGHAVRRYGFILCG